MLEKKASSKVKLILAEHFDDWISDLMNNLTKVDKSAVKFIQIVPLEIFKES